MTVLPQYDEFDIYIKDDIRCFITSLFETGILSEEEVISNCIKEFGGENFNLIEKVLYGED